MFNASKTMDQWTWGGTGRTDTLCAKHTAATMYILIVPRCPMLP